MLLRFPALLAGLLLGLTLFSLVIAIYPLGVSVAGNRFLQGEISKGIVTAYGMGITYENENVRFDMPSPDDAEKPIHVRQEELFESEIAEIQQLGEVLGSVRGPQVTVTSSEDSRDGRLFFRENALSHVRVIAGAPGDGVFISDYTAEPLGIEPGDKLTLEGRERSVMVTVDGIYAALFREPPAPFWRPWRSSIAPPCAGDPGTSGCTPPPPFILAGKQQVIELSQRLGFRGATFGWDAPLRDVDSFTLEDAETLEHSYGALAREMSDPDSPLYEVFLCCGPQYVRATRYITETRLSSVVQEVTSQTQQRLDAAETPLRVLQAIAACVAVAAILTATGYSLSARRTEMTVYFARGHRPWEVGLRFSLEIALLSIIGVGAGVGGAIALADLATGSTQVSRRVLADVVMTAGLLAPAATVGVGVTAGFLFWRRRPTRETKVDRGTLRLVAEVILVLAAVSLLATTISGPSRLGPAQVATPLLVLAASAVITARILERVLAGIAKWSTKLPHPFYLAIRRASAGRVGLLLFALALTFFGVFQHGLSIASTLEDTVIAKSRLFVGSDVAATVDVGDVPPDDLPWASTPAWRIPHVAVGDTSREVDVIAVDPDSLPAAAYWDRRFGATSLETLMEKLESAGQDIPAIFVGEDEDQSLSLSFGNTQLEVDRVANVDAFPGMLSKRPTLVVPQEHLRAALEDRSSGLLSSSAVAAEWWVRGNADDITRALPGLEDPPYGIVTAEDVRDIPYIATTLATFRILDTLGLVGAALVIVASLAYLQSKERARAVSSQLALRMGMRKRSHTMAVVIELSLFIVAAYGLAIIPAGMMARVLAAQIDPLWTIPPDVLFDLPLGWIAGGGFVVVMASLVGGHVVAARSLRTNMANLMRVAE